MPRMTDTDLNREKDEFISFTQMVDCPECDTTQDVTFPTKARDEDGLADIEDGDLEVDVTCPKPSCNHKWRAIYEGWQNYGSA